MAIYPPLGYGASEQISPTSARIETIGFDLDGTLIVENTWELMHAAVGVPAEQDLEWYRLFTSHQIDYNEWLRLIEHAYIKRGATRGILESVLNQVHYQEGCLPLLNSLRRHYHLAIISSSADILVGPLAKRLGIPYWKANCHFHFDRQDHLTAITWDGDEQDMKPHHMRQLSAKIKCKRGRWAFVGDSHNDTLALRAARKGIAFCKDASRTHFNDLPCARITTLYDLESLFLPEHDRMRGTLGAPHAPQDVPLDSRV